MSTAGDLDRSALPVECEDWEVAPYAFDQARDPNSSADFADFYLCDHGRLLVGLDVTLDAKGNAGVLVQFVHADFASGVADPPLGALIVDVSLLVRERHHEAGYFEVECYEDGLIAFGLLLDTRALEELRRYAAASVPATRHRSRTPAAPAESATRTSP